MIDDATWERLAMGELSEAERAETLAHVLRCRECAAIYKGLLRLEAGARAAGLEGPPPERSPGAIDPPSDELEARRRRRWPWISGVVTALAAAAVLALWWRGRERSSELEPGVTRGSGRPEVELRAPAGSPPVLDWLPVVGALRYRVSVFTTDGRSVLIRELDAPPLAWPQGGGVAAGDYTWKVEALDAHGPIATSRLARLRLAP